LLEFVCTKSSDHLSFTRTGQSEPPFINNAIAMELEHLDVSWELAA
jgi:hypothetical protein